MPVPIQTTHEKALQLNLDETVYGSIVEIGAGQEVARRFFSAGAAAGTVAKTMSAYDMHMSDEIYGKADRYVGRNRVQQMLSHEYALLEDRLSESRPKTRFFSYAATVTARSFKGGNECHGWVGIRYQFSAGGPVNDILMHVRMLDGTSVAQADALGILGVNIINGAFQHCKAPKLLIGSLLDNIGQGRLEIDLIHFSGHEFTAVDNRLMNLQLIHSWLTRAVMFDEQGQPTVPRDKIYKKPVLVTRGSFKPPTKLHADMGEFGMKQFCEYQQVNNNDVLSMAEITLSELVSGGKVEDADFISRVDLLANRKTVVLVSDYLRFFRLRSWLRQYTNDQIGIVLSVLDFNYLFDPSFYEGLEGGILEAMGKLFSDNTHLYVYPAIIEGKYVDLNNVKVAPEQKRLLQYLIENKLLLPFKEYRVEHLHISARELIKQIPKGNGSWELGCNPEVVAAIKSLGLFGYPKS